MIRRLSLIALCLLALGLSAQSALAVTYNFSVTLVDNDTPVEGVELWCYTYNAQFQLQASKEMTETAPGIYNAQFANQEPGWVFGGCSSIPLTLFRKTRLGIPLPSRPSTGCQTTSFGKWTTRGSLGGYRAGATSVAPANKDLKLNYLWKGRS